VLVDLGGTNRADHQGAAEQPWSITSVL